MPALIPWISLFLAKGELDAQSTVVSFRGTREMPRWWCLAGSPQVGDVTVKYHHQRALSFQIDEGVCVCVCKDQKPTLHVYLYSPIVLYM